MPYPLQFRPNTTCHLWNPDGTPLDAGKDLQLFRPMLGTRINPLVPDFDQHMEPGGSLLRFVVESDALSAFRVGPANWRTRGLPFLTLDEDTLAEEWWITDYVPWDNPSAGERLCAGFASKRMTWFPPMIAAPAGGANYDLTAPELLYGPLYSVTIPANSKVIYRWNHLLGDSFLCMVMAESLPGITQLVIKGGSPASPQILATPAAGVLIYSNNPVTLSPSGFLIVWIAFNNTSAVSPLDIVFTFRRGTEVGRDVR